MLGTILGKASWTHQQQGFQNDIVYIKNIKSANVVFE